MDDARRPPPRVRRRGAALILVVVLCAVLITIVGVLLRGSLVASRATTATWHHAGAHCAARSAVWSACNALTSDRRGDTSGTLETSWTLMKATDADGDGFGDFSADDLFRALGDGYFESRVRPEADVYVVRGRGAHGGVLRTLEAYAMPQGVGAVRPFTAGLFSEGPLTVRSNATFDSFDSRVAGYDDHATTTTIAGKKIKNQSGGVGSNSTIELYSNSRVFGDAAPGTASTISLYGTSFVTGSTASLAEPVVNPPATWNVPDPADPDLRMDALGLAHGDAVMVNGGTLPVGPGTYVVSSVRALGTSTIRFTGSPGDVVELFITGGASAAAAPSLLLDSNASLVVDPGVTVRVYNAGKLRTSSNTALNASGAAEQFVYMSSYASAGATDLGVDLRSNSTMAAVIYAPRATFVHNSNAGYFGSVVVGRASVESAGFFHYDEALAGLRLPVRLQPSWYSPVAMHEVR